MGMHQQFLTFANYLHNEGIKLSSVCESLKYCIITSEACNNEEERYISDALGVQGNK